MKSIILFDGECNFCDQSVLFIIKRDKRALFKFASIQSEVGQEIIKNYHIPPHIDSIILVEKGICYYQSTAALKICKHLKGVWKLFYILILIPKPIRDFMYNIIARNRYKWFGKKEACILPSPEIRKRFLSDLRDSKAPLLDNTVEQSE